MKELANSRLAMFAFSGCVTQAVLTGNTFPYLFGDATTFGSEVTRSMAAVPLSYVTICRDVASATVMSLERGGGADGSCELRWWL